MNDFEDFTNSMQKMDYDALKELFKDKNLDFITELTDREIRAISIILFLADYAELPEFKTFISNVMRLKVSKNRKGRKEYIEGFIGIKDKERLMQQPQQVIR